MEKSKLLKRRWSASVMGRVLEADEKRALSWVNSKSKFDTSSGLRWDLLEYKLSLFGQLTNQEWLEWRADLAVQQLLPFPGDVTEEALDLDIFSITLSVSKALLWKFAEELKKKN